MHKPIMSYTSWVQIPLSGVDHALVAKRLASLGFQDEDELLRDTHGREAKFIENTTLELRVPKTDLVDEQEQFEFIAGVCGLDTDLSV